jgi:ankyrin repeat protein
MLSKNPPKKTLSLNGGSVDEYPLNASEAFKEAMNIKSKVLEEYLKKCPKKKINLPTDKLEGLTPLMYAAKYGLTAAVQELLKIEGIKPNEPISATTDKKREIALPKFLNAFVRSAPKTEGIQPEKKSETPLSLAEKNGHTEVVKLLKSFMILSDPVQTPEAAASMLVEAAKDGDLERIYTLACRGATLIGYMHVLPSQEESTTEQEEIAGTILGIELTIDAAEGSQLQVENLLEAKANVNIIDSKGRTPLLRAVDQRRVDFNENHEKIIDLLLREKANANLGQDTFGRTTLALAAIRGFGTVVDKLIAARADVNKKNQRGTTPLIDAALYGDKAIVESLLKAKANITECNDAGLNALSMAQKRLETSLLESWCNIYSARSLHWDEEINKSTQILQTLRAHQLVLAAQSKVRDKHNVIQNLVHERATLIGHQTALENLVTDEKERNATAISIYNIELRRATKREEPSKISQLLEKKADVDYHNELDPTPLMIAAKKGNPEIVEMLLTAKAKVNVEYGDVYEPTSLICAATSGNVATIKLLLEAKAKANINYIKEDGFNGTLKKATNQTALMAAARWGNCPAVKLLLQEDADPNIKDINDSTAMDLAIFNKKTETVQTLQLYQLINEGDSDNLVNFFKKDIKISIDDPTICYAAKKIDLSNETDITGSADVLRILLKHNQTSKFAGLRQSLDQAFELNGDTRKNYFNEIVVPLLSDFQPAEISNAGRLGTSGVLSSNTQSQIEKSRGDTPTGPTKTIRSLP